MFDVAELLRRQAEWQRSRRLLPWPEKIRMALVMRETALRFREMRAAAAQPREQKGEDATPPEPD